MSCIAFRYTNLALLVGALLGFAPAEAHAFAFANFCGTPNEKIDGPLAETRNACSIPDGSMKAEGYFGAVANWDRGSNLPVTASFVRSASNCNFSSGDGSNEVVLVNRSNIDGQNGLTTYADVNFCALNPFGGGNYGETDARIASDMNFDRPDMGAFVTPDKTVVGSGRVTIAHEIGHQLGLAHAGGFNIMNTVRRPLCAQSSNPMCPMPDEILGVAQLYGNKNIQNLMGSGQRFDSQFGVQNNRLTFAVAQCRSLPLTITFTVINTGLSPQTFNQTFFVSTSNILFQTGITIGNWFGGTVNPRNMFTWSANFSLPATLPVGTYFVFHKVDHDNRISENNESDNVVRQAGAIIVNDC